MQSPEQATAEAALIFLFLFLFLFIFLTILFWFNDKEFILDEGMDLPAQISLLKT